LFDVAHSLHCAEDIALRCAGNDELTALACVAAARLFDTGPVAPRQRPDPAATQTPTSAATAPAAFAATAPLTDAVEWTVSSTRTAGHSAEAVT
jgi:hypothetical protein